MLNRTVVFAVALATLGPVVAMAQTSSSNPTQAPVTGAPPSGAAKTESPGSAAGVPAVSAPANPAQNSSNPTQAPVSGGAAPSGAAKTEAPAPTANVPAASAQPTPAQNSSNPTQAPVPGSPSGAAKTEAPAKQRGGSDPITTIRARPYCKAEPFPSTPGWSGRYRSRSEFRKAMLDCGFDGFATTRALGSQ